MLASSGAVTPSSSAMSDAVEVPLSEIMSRVTECSECGDLYWFIVRGRPEELAVEFDRHSRLLRCATCGSLYDYYAEGRGDPERLTIDEARLRFPGAL